MATLKLADELEEYKWEEAYYLKALIGNKLPTDDGVIRKIFVIRKFVTVQLILNPENDYERIRNLHRRSGATIGITSDKESREIGFEYLELVGSAEQVNTAESLIEAIIKEKYKQTYDELSSFPPAFMESTFYYKRISLPDECKIWMLMGWEGINLMRVEAHTGAWLETDVDDDTSEVNGIRIYGSHVNQVNKAFDLLTRIISKLLLEPATDECVWDLLCEEIPALNEYDLREAEKQPPSKKQRIMNQVVGNETMDMECVVVT